MTLLTICQNAADEIGILRPTSVVGNGADEAAKLLRYAKKVGNQVMKGYEWQVLRKEQTFTAIAGETQTGILPSDFDRFVPETFWDRSGTRLLAGPVSAVEWQGLKAHSYAGRIPKFIYRGDSISVLPALGAGVSLAFEYVSKNWCQSSGAAPQATWAADADTAIVDEELITYGVIFEYLDGDGQPSTVAANRYMEYWKTLLGNERADANILAAGDLFGAGRHFTGAPASDG